MIRCPTCGQQLRPPFEGLELRIYTALVHAGGRGMTVRELIDYLYAADPIGGPLYPQITISLVKKKLNMKLALFGAKIICTRKGRGARYMLMVAPSLTENHHGWSSIVATCTGRSTQRTVSPRLVIPRDRG
jgi:hypothetical protein